jgi:transcriptional regulator with XRE-family HTH domain
MNDARVGTLLREWRQRRCLSQMDLALDAGVSTRHLSFVETGRSKPSAEMVLHLAERLEVPLRERNQLLLAGGYAPAYPQHGLDAPQLAAVRSALRQVLAAHEPYPALVLNRYWELLDANAAAGQLLTGLDEHLLTPPVNVLRVSLHPDGLAPRIANLAQWRTHLLHQLWRRAGATADEKLRELYDELLAYPGGIDPGPVSRATVAAVVPLRLRSHAGELALFSLASHVQTAADVTVDELTIESFYPADAATAAALTRSAASPGSHPPSRTSSA